jgi:hypothetical protein
MLIAEMPVRAPWLRASLQGQWACEGRLLHVDEAFWLMRLFRLVLTVKVDAIEVVVVRQRRWMAKAN